MNRDRSSLSQIFFKIDVLKNFANFKGKHLCWSLFLIKLQVFKPIIKRPQHRCFPLEICEIPKCTYFEEQSANDCSY